MSQGGPTPPPQGGPTPPPRTSSLTQPAPPPGFPPLPPGFESQFANFGINQQAPRPPPPDYPTPPPSGSRTRVAPRAPSPTLGASASQGATGYTPSRPAPAPPSTPPGRHTPSTPRRSAPGPPPPPPPEGWPANYPRKLSGLDHFAKKMRGKKVPQSAFIREDTKHKPLPKEQGPTKRPSPVHYVDLFEYNVESMKSIIDLAATQDRNAAIETINRLPLFARAVTDMYNQCIIGWDRPFYNHAALIMKWIRRENARGWPKLPDMIERLSRRIGHLDGTVDDWKDLAELEDSDSDVSD